jgi:chemotaxis signal transduction protein
MNGYVLFRLGDRRFVTKLDEVREIVRLSGLETLPGMRPPLAGVVVLRGAPLPVLDVRAAEVVGTDGGDVLVMDVEGDAVGIAVDQVLAVLGATELQEAEPPAKALPSYVVGVRRDANGPLLLVDLHLLLDVTTEGWRDALAEQVSIDV